MIGQTIAHYRVTEKLGAGGMGEVYRATDTKLGRDVALKVLPEAFVQDAQRMARFQREAQVLASLNHPHIATIHGLEESGTTRALAMELVEGPTLADRIAGGAIPLEEALPIARQITEALEYAHDLGIVHRDLKPANVKLTREGQVKVLDFGLAKALFDDASTSSKADYSPTLSVASTRAGLILGTASYMAPEQAKGRSVDRRADVWAFGAVLFEILCGKRAFQGDDVSEILASVIKSDPDWTALPAETPAQIRKLLRRCLEKDAKRRLQAIGEARIQLEEVQADATAPSPVMTAAAPVLAPAWQRNLPWVATGILTVALVATLWALWPRAQAAKVPVRFSAELGADASLDVDMGPAAILSPDGTMLAFAARKDSASLPQLYLRRLDQLQASPLPGTEGARNAFFDPEGQWIAFFAGGKLKKISVTGGAAITLCDAPGDRGGTWADDGTIVFASTNRGALSKVSTAGGKPEALTKLDEKSGEATHRWPQVLPGGKAVLFTANNALANFDDATIVVQPLVPNASGQAGGERKIVLRGGFYARYVPSGHLSYMHKGTLFAAPFNLEKLELSGQPVPAVEGVTSTPFFAGAQYSFSREGTFVYLPGTSTTSQVSIQWMDAQGKFRPLRAVPGDYSNFRFAPDGRRLAMGVFDGTHNDVWVFDWERDTPSRLTFDPGEDNNPVWSPDGRRIAYSSQGAAKGSPNIYSKRSDGTGDVQRLTESKNVQIPGYWHPSGKFLAFYEQDPKTSWDIMILPLEGDENSGWKPGKPTPFLNTTYVEVNPAFSPDGRWLAYMSNETGQPEIYVRPFPGPGGKWQVSTGGGWLPVWSRTSKQLFYRTTEQKIMVAGYTSSGDSFRHDKPRLWSDGQFTMLAFARNFDLHPDGKRFAVAKSLEAKSEAKRDKVVFVQNFFDELRRIAPAGKK